MRLRGVRRSRNIEDRRRSGGGGKAGIGGVGLILVLAIGYFAGIDVTPLLQQVPQQSAAPRDLSEAEQQAADFSARVLGTPSACMASLTMYSRSTGPSAARPSPPREKGVRPEPLSWRSRRWPSRPITSPNNSARPSPSCGTKLPN